MLTFTANYSLARSHAPAQTRNGSVDLLRFAGAIGIILFHCGAPGSWFGLAALPMFVTLLVFYGAGRPIKNQAKRLLVPWIAWSGIYAVLKITQSVVTGTPLSDEFAPWMLLTGASLHLWFLPFSFLFLAVCSVIPARVPTSLLWLICIALSGAAIWMFNTDQVPVPFAQWLAVVPAALAGLLMQRTPSKFSPPIVLALGGFTALLFGFDGMTEQLMIAGLAVALVIAAPLPQTCFTDFLSGVSFGMYLVHPAIIATSFYVLPTTNDLFVPLILVGSLTATAILRKTAPALV